MCGGIVAALNLPSRRAVLSAAAAGRSLRTSSGSSRCTSPTAPGGSRAIPRLAQSPAASAESLTLADTVMPIQIALAFVANALVVLLGVYLAGAGSGVARLERHRQRALAARCAARATLPAGDTPGARDRGRRGVGLAPLRARLQRARARARERRRAARRDRDARVRARHRAEPARRRARAGALSQSASRARASGARPVSSWRPSASGARSGPRA